MCLDTSAKDRDWKREGKREREWERPMLWRKGYIYIGIYNICSGGENINRKKRRKQGYIYIHIHIMQICRKGVCGRSLHEVIMLMFIWD